MGIMYSVASVEMVGVQRQIRNPVFHVEISVRDVLVVTNPTSARPAMNKITLCSMETPAHATKNTI